MNRPFLRALSVDKKYLVAVGSRRWRLRFTALVPEVLGIRLLNTLFARHLIGESPPRDSKFISASVSLIFLPPRSSNTNPHYLHTLTRVMASPSTLHPPRLAGMFTGMPSAPGTPVHSIQTMRRKAAGHSGPLTKILVANRGVCLIITLFMIYS